MHYFDKSFLAPLTLSESTNELIAAIFDGLSAEDLATGHAPLDSAISGIVPMPRVS